MYIVCSRKDTVFWLSPNVLANIRLSMQMYISELPQDILTQILTLKAHFQDCHPMACRGRGRPTAPRQSCERGSHVRCEEEEEAMQCPTEPCHCLAGPAPSWNSNQTAAHPAGIASPTVTDVRQTDCCKCRRLPLTRQGRQVGSRGPSLLPCSPNLAWKWAQPSELQTPQFLRQQEGLQSCTPCQGQLLPVPSLLLFQPMEEWSWHSSPRWGHLKQKANDLCRRNQEICLVLRAVFERIVAVSEKLRNHNGKGR